MESVIKTVNEFNVTGGAKRGKLFLDPALDALKFSLIEEEFKELKKALEEKNPVETVDAICDLQYVLAGFVDCLGLTDVVIEAFKQVHTSNMTKFCKSEEEAILTQNKYTKEGISTIRKPYNNVWVVTRTDGKILKNINYKPVDLSWILQKEEQK